MNKSEKSKAAYTILSRNYLGQALALKDSFLKYNNDVDFFIILVDRKTTEVNKEIEELPIIWAEDLAIDNYWRHAFKFDVIEWSTNVKPFAAKHLLSQYEKVLYLDPDLFFYKNINWIFEELSNCSVVVTPHATQPIYDKHPQGDLEWMRVGTFNLGFIGMRKSLETDNLLDWWGQRCLTDGFLETTNGVFVDQKWLTLAIGFFPGIKILFNKGINVATWNLHERKLISVSPEPTLEDYTPLYFFHFSGFNYDNPGEFNKRQSRWQLGSRPDFEPLAQSYKLALKEHNFKERINLNYSNDFFDDGTYVSPLIRKVYALLFDNFKSENPFSKNSDIYQYGKKNNLIGSKYSVDKRLFAKDVASYSTQINIINFFLRLALRVLGPNRYFNLMRYLGYISSIRNQSGVFKK
jgi:hypothetical protein